MWTKLGREAGLGAVNLLHTLQFGGEEGDCNLPVGSSVLCLKAPKGHRWVLNVAEYGNSSHNSFALLEKYGHKPRRTALYFGTSQVTNVWHDWGASKLGLVKNFAALRVVIVGVATKSRFSPLVPYMQAALWNNKASHWNCHLYKINQKQIWSRSQCKKHLWHLELLSCGKFHPHWLFLRIVLPSLES